ncbi:hypothetical protein T484DRAFT_1814049, partial [Baffinella frigidus]
MKQAHSRAEARDNEDLRARLIRLAAVNEQVVAGAENLESLEALGQARVEALQVSQQQLRAEKARLEGRVAELEVAVESGARHGEAAIERLGVDLEQKYGRLLRRQEEAAVAKVKSLNVLVSHALRERDAAARQRDTLLLHLQRAAH